MDTGIHRQPRTPHAVLAVLLLAGSALPSPASDAPGRPSRLPRFSTTLDVVNVNVSVSDPRGQVVTDLGPGDFRVIEDGVPQDVVLFSERSVPLSVALLLDGSGSMSNALPVVKAAASRLVRTLGPEDEAEVVLFNHRSAVLQDFTPEKPSLDAAIQRLSAGGPTALYAAVYVMLKDSRFQPRPDDVRRRAIVVLTDGEDTSSLVTDDQVLELARRRDATVYTISLRATRIDDSERASQIHRASYFLNTLARDTGGRAYFPVHLRDLDGVYDGIARELRAQYLIGYVSSNPVPQGWRRIAIQSSRDSVMVRHRPGYYAGRGGGAGRQSAVGGGGGIAR
jgi:Ca-activated chloride channel homolog